MRRKPTRTAASPRNATGVNVVRVESAQPYGWIVYREGSAKTHFARALDPALAIAREWAEATRPSVILVVGPDGKVDVERTYAAIALHEAC